MSRPSVATSLTYVAAIILVFPFLAPVIWALIASFSTNNLITLNSLALPDSLHVENYVNAWTNSDMGVFVWNSLIVAVSSSLLITVAATGLGYALARLSFKGQRVLYVAIVAAIGLPIYAYLLALVGVVRGIGQIDSLLGVIVVTSAVFLPVPTLLIHGFFKVLPSEVVDAARVDGASDWRVFRSIMLPLARPALLTVMIFGFVWAWNDVLIPVMLLGSPEKFTIPYGIAALRPSDFRTDYVSVFAGSMLSTIPMLGIYMFFQRRFVAGLTWGSSVG